MAIWVIKDGQREGPYEEQDVRELIYEGTYGDADPAIRDGQFGWSTVGQILGRPMPSNESTPAELSEPSPPEVPPGEPIPVAAVTEPQPPPVPVPMPEPVAPAPVTIVDFQMPFGSMVIFMVKWVIAAIPALLILGALAAMFWMGCMALLALVLHH